MLTCASAQAISDNDGAAATMRSNIKSYLAQKGYNSTIDSDGDIKFKYEGYSYYISCENYSDMVYMTVSRYLGADGVSLNKLFRACNDVIRGLKLVRIYLNSDHTQVVIECAAAISSVREFKPMFYNYLDIIQIAKKRLEENLDE